MDSHGSFSLGSVGIGSISSVLNSPSTEHRFRYIVNPMKTLKTKLLQKLSIVAFGFAGFSPFCVAANPATSSYLINENFDAPLSSAVWKGFPKGILESVVEGQFVMKADASAEATFAVFSIWPAAAMPELNFLKNTVTISITDLGLSGTASPEHQVLVFSLFKDNPHSMQTTESIRVRLDGNGELTVGMNTKGVGNVQLWSAQVSTLIKSVVLKLDPAGITIQATDASGTHEGQAPWPVKVASWAGSSPFFNIETQRKPDTGDVQGVIGDLKISSTPVPVK